VLTVIGSSPDRQAWLADCSASIQREHIAVVNYGYELGKIAWVMQHTTADRFLFLQDTWQVKSDSFWALLDGHGGSVALMNHPYFFGCFAGVYERHVIEKIGVPTVTEKYQSIVLEREWHRHYVEHAGEPVVLFPDLNDRNATRVVERHGRENLVLENDYVVKWKGTWHPDDS